MNEKINIQDIIDYLAERHGMSKRNADGFVKEFFLLIEQALESDKHVKIKGLGIFKLIEVDSRESVNVNTGERFQIDEHTKISFTPDPTLRDVINKPFAYFESVVLNENTIIEDTSIDESEDEIENSAELVAKVMKGQVKEDIEPKLTAEDIIAAELQHSNVQFKRVLLEEAKSQPTQLDQAIQSAPSVNSDQPIRKSPIPYLVTIILLVLLLSGSALLFIYYPDVFSPVQKELAAKSDSISTIQQKVLLDTVAVVKDTVPEVVLHEKEKVPVVIATTKIPLKIDSATYKIVGTKTTYVVKEGDTLARLAIHFYGSKDFWPYIVQHNSDTIKNPDYLPYGTTLKIPELVKR